MTQAERSIPFFDYPALFTSCEQELTEIFVDVGRRGAFIQQRDLEQFEQSLAEYVGAKYVLGIANATDALHLSLRAAGITTGDEVLFCSHTMVATAAAVHYAGGVPVPVECGPDHLIDPDAVEAAITPRTRAILPTQLNGRVCDMDALRDIVARRGLVLLEDAAQALGATFRGQAAGTFGLAGCISFYPAKTLGCLGDGGCVITNDDEMYRKLQLLRDHGRDETGEIRMWGLNSRLDNLQAAILLHRLKSYDQAIARRREVAALYCERLRNLPTLRLPPAPASDPQRFDIFQNFEIEAEDRDALRERLADRGIGTLVQWGGKPVHQFADLGLRGALPYTDHLYTRLLMLPMNTTLSDDDVHFICDCISEFYAQANRSNSLAA